MKILSVYIFYNMKKIVSNTLYFDIKTKVHLDNHTLATP
ncbi:hypothetical protein FUAX_09010 [Fulvitalea axinellae]|uniref:Uncharacterized protein n=1 Tax=Fulvitalea axinellae TaxID=1182444 RepID=A0AAU9CQ17_9BACT|nr:hypothetical protein FUAX_09010 [Fulvitalea axinellae]